MDWTTTGASPPICTPPTKTGLVFLLWISELKKNTPAAGLVGITRMAKAHGIATVGDL
jgi:hypothetical protein